MNNTYCIRLNTNKELKYRNNMVYSDIRWCNGHRHEMKSQKAGFEFHSASLYSPAHKHI